MFNSKYSKVLTGLLVVVIILIVGTIGYFVYDIYFVKAKNKELTEVSEEFSSKIRKKQKDNSNNTVEENIANPVEGMVTEKDNQTASNEKKFMEGYEIMGSISIPKTKINYPILEKVTKKSLETSVAILYGVGLNQPGNTTIVGHNYRNGLFFSDNKKLSNGDIINITDQAGETVTYSIYNMYETSPSDADYMMRDTEGAREISLSTCTDDSSARLIILAKEQ